LYGSVINRNDEVDYIKQAKIIDMTDDSMLFSLKTSYIASNDNKKTETTICNFDQKKIKVKKLDYGSQYEAIYDDPDNDCWLKITIDASTSQYRDIPMYINYRGECNTYCNKSKIPKNRSSELLPTTDMFSHLENIKRRIEIKRAKELQKKETWK